MLVLMTNRSPRADNEVLEELLADWNQIASKPYKTVTFSSYDRNGIVIYHTDCMMTLLHEHSVICLDAIKNKKERQNVILALTSTNTENDRPY
jgi:hypothetical protein